MILPSLAVGLTLVNVVISHSSGFVKRQNSTPSSAAAAALYLNSVVAYEICQIAQGVFAASTALGGNSTFTTDSSCVLPISPNAITTSLVVTGCATYIAPIISNPPIIGGNTCSPAYVTSDGHITPNDGSAQANFTIPSSNKTCAGITNPFILTPINASSNTFVANQFNVNCTSGVITLADLTLHLCTKNDNTTLPYFYSTTDLNCTDARQISAQVLMM